MSFIISLLAATCQRTGERFAISQKLHSLSKTSYCLFAFQSAFKKQCHFQCIFNTIWKYFQYYFKVFSILFQSIFFRYHLKVFSAPLQTLPSFTFASFCKISSPQLLEVGKMWYLGFELQYGSWGSRSWKLEGFPRFFFQDFPRFFFHYAIHLLFPRLPFPNWLSWSHDQPPLSVTFLPICRKLNQGPNHEITVQSDIPRKVKK